MTMFYALKFPNKYKNNRPIRNINKVELSKNDFIYHAGTKFNHDKLFSNGGRVLNVTSVEQIFVILEKNYLHIKKLNWKDGLPKRYWLESYQLK